MVRMGGILEDHQRALGTLSEKPATVLRLASSCRPQVKEDWYADFRQTGGEIGIFQAPVAGKLARPPHGQIHLHGPPRKCPLQAVPATV